MASAFPSVGLEISQLLPPSPSATATLNAPPETSAGTRQPISSGQATQIDNTIPLTSRYPPVPFTPKPGCKDHWTYIGCRDAKEDAFPPSLFLLPVNANGTSLHNNDCASKTHLAVQNLMMVDTECYPSNLGLIGTTAPSPTGRRIVRGGTMATTACYSGFDKIPDTFLNDGKTTQALCCLRFVFLAQS
jgi:hypothetical protein